MIAALGGFCMIGNFYDHYFLPVLVPLAICVAPVLARGPFSTLWGIAIVCWMFAYSPPLGPKRVNAEIADSYALADAVRPYVKDRCLEIYDGPSVIYMMTEARTCSRFTYPDHLSNAVEANALGIDSTAEMARVLAGKPGAIVTSSMKVIPTLNETTRHMVRASLLRDYKTVAIIRNPERTFYVHALKSLVKPSTPLPHADALADQAY